MEYQPIDIGKLTVKAYAAGLVTAKWFTNSQSKVVNNGGGTKQYRFTRRVVRAIKSKVAVMVHQRDTKGLTLWFVTLTSKDMVRNDVLSKFVENLRKRGKINEYVWVRELQERGVNHWHIIFTSDQQRQDYALWRKAWNSALFNAGATPSNNSVRWGAKPRVFGSVESVEDYLVKYCTKDDYVSDERLTGSSRIEYVKNKELVSCFTDELRPVKSGATDWSRFYVFDNNSAYQEWWHKESVINNESQYEQISTGSSVEYADLHS